MARHDWTEVTKILDQMVNDWYTTAEITRLLSMRLTPAIADVEHSHIFDEVFGRYVLDERSAEEVVRGAEESLTIERAFHGAVATAMLELEETV